MQKLKAFYFSGTGNTRYITLRLCEKLSDLYETSAFDIARECDFALLLKEADLILLAFPIYGSAPPFPMRRFVYRYRNEFQGKTVMIAVTQVMFSGDGAASLGRTVEKFGGNVKFAEHFNMPNNLSDCKILAIRNGSELADLLERADKRMNRFVRRIEKGKSFRRGFHPLSHAVGYYCQRKYWRRGEVGKKNSLQIDRGKCVGCGICSKQCPVKNITVTNGFARPQGNCAFCYRCVNACPKQAITLFGKSSPVKQYKGIPFVGLNGNENP